MGIDRSAVRPLFGAFMLCASLPLLDVAGAQPGGSRGGAEPDITESSPSVASAREAMLLSGIRQLTFAGRRAGEGYFSRDGRQMVFQSEREPGNPFFQIYRMDLQTGDVQRISPGYGKTTCAWIHPQAEKILFASTHEDPDARRKQAEEIQRRESGPQRRYAWDYDQHYEIYVFDSATGEYTNLTKTLGYDAEGSWSPDGRRIAFTSNRRAYAGKMSAEERKAAQRDAATLNDIYIMADDGSHVRRLTESLGYDGGPFFSPDGQRICWRHFEPNGAVAEIWTMGIDGTDKHQLTDLGAMSWAPFYHPSGEYLIFATNLHGFGNFELYLIDRQGESTPMRVTFREGFDGLPAFSPDGKRLAWTSNRTASGQSQIFLADWNHEAARELLGIAGASPEEELVNATATAAAADAARQSTPEFAAQDIRRHVEYLCRPELQGRLTGSPGERLATAYVAGYMERLGLEPAGEEGTWFQEFEFTSGVALGADNRLVWGEKSYELNRDWMPTAFSKNGRFAAAPVVFAGYGIAAPGDDENDPYDSFVHLDVTGKWVMAFRYLPEQVTAERRQHLARYASLRYKAMLVRDKGAAGLILVSGPNAHAKSQLVPLRFDGSLAGTSIPVISVTDAVAQAWLQPAGKRLKALQDELDAGRPLMGFALDGVALSASVDLHQMKRKGRNVLGLLTAAAEPSDQRVLVGAHVDHLGKGPSSSSLARGDERNGIHFGADDNASGVAAMLEIAEFLADQKRQGKLRQRRDVLLAAWSGEEVGLIGSTHFAKHFATASGASDAEALYPRIAACLNLDMVGRLRKKLILQGVGSSSAWAAEIERRNAPVGLPIALQEDSYLPSDANSFYVRGVPILSAFTGPHSEYHTPRDRPETLNYEGAARIARLMALIARSLAIGERPPDYVAQRRPERGGQRAALRAYLGTIPDYAESDAAGVKLSGVAKGGPADTAGVRGGDLVVELAGKKIENIYDYTYAIEALKIGQPTSIVVRRNGRRRSLRIVPGSRE